MFPSSIDRFLYVLRASSKSMTDLRKEMHDPTSDYILAIFEKVLPITRKHAKECAEESAIPELTPEVLALLEVIAVLAVRVRILEKACGINPDEPTAEL